MRTIFFIAITALGLIALRGDRRAYGLFVLLGLAYFPLSAGFPLQPRACRIVFGWTEATTSFANVGHIVLFAIFFVMTLAQFRERNARAMAWSALATLLMGAAVEGAQGITGHGNCRLRDLIPDVIGIAIAAVTVFLWRRVRVPRGSAALLLVITVMGCGEAPYVVTKELSYDPAIGIYGMFDVYEPKSDSTRTGRPAIVAIHGGAWRTGDKVWGEQIAEALCPLGYVVFSVNYRLAGRPNSRWPAQLKDVQQSVRYIRANAQRFRIDPERMASLGMSAGGHLATMVALRDDATNPTARVSFAVNLDGEHDMTMPPEQVMDDFDSILTDVMGHPAPWSDAELRDISTVTFARPDVAVLTIHGAGDDNVYVAQGERITAALQAAGAETEFVRIEGREGNCHSDCWRVPVARDAIVRFLGRKLAAGREP